MDKAFQAGSVQDFVPKESDQYSPHFWRQTQQHGQHLDRLDQYYEQLGGLVIDAAVTLDMAIMQKNPGLPRRSLATRTLPHLREFNRAWKGCRVPSSSFKTPRKHGSFRMEVTRGDERHHVSKKPPSTVTTLPVI